MTESHDVAALAFPGVGVRLSGCEAGFYQKHRGRLRPLLEEASSAAGMDLEFALLRDQIGSAGEKSRQLFTYAFSTGVALVLREQGLVPAYAAGYSFGVYAALHATGMISFSDGLTILAQAYSLMRSACNGHALGMGYVVGLTRGEIEKLLAGRLYCGLVLVNSNSDTCNVLAGPRETLEGFLAEAQDRGALAAECLSVKIPYHHPTLLGKVSPQFRSYLERFSWNPPSCPLVSSIDQRLLTAPEEIVDFTARNLSTPNNWQKVVGTLAGVGVTRMFECGPGISLSQNGRFLPHDIQYFNVKNLQRGLER
jgi:[acyl-carrier-protein] S-malonyltransferase